MKRLYLHNTSLTFTGNDELLQLLQSVIAVVPASLQYSEKLGKSLPSKKPTNRTKHYYEEQEIYNRSTGERVAVIRDGKLETLNKLDHPFNKDIPITDVELEDDPPTRALKGRTPKIDRRHPLKD